MRFIPPPSLSVNRVRWFRGGGVLSEFIKYDILGKASLYNVPATVAMKTASSGQFFQNEE